jgi:hypothetical protein
MITKTIIGVLLCCLIAVIGLFLYSDSQLQSEQPTVITSANDSQSQSIEASVNTDPPVSATGDAIPAAQSDKPLPIPARQLKKLIKDKPSTTELDQKIQSANQAIARLDKQLDAESPQQTTTAESVSADTADEKSEDIKKRLEHLRDHLNKQP